MKLETKLTILLKLLLGEEMWIPKSFTKSRFDPKSRDEQPFYIDSWIIEKSQIPIEN